MKKKLIALTLSALMVTGLVGCGNSEDTKVDTKVDFKVGMVTDAGTIDDKSFNQGTWEGILKAKEELGVESNYIKPAGTTEADYMKEIGNLYDTGYKFIVAPGFKFETAIFNAQAKYPDAKFVIIDGSPNNGKEGDAREAKVGENTVAVFFAEHEAGFVAGVATALQLKEGELGFIGGMESPVISKFDYGFRAGVKAANPKCELTVRYLNSFSDSALAKSVANQMHKDGVDVIYTAAGAAGTGAIEAAKENNKMAIGVDVDQSPLAPDNIISSTMKNVNVSIVNLVGEILEDNYQGGQVIVNTLASGGVGLSDTTKDHVSKDILDYVNEQAGKIKSGEIVVPENEKQYNEIVGK